MKLNIMLFCIKPAVKHSTSRVAQNKIHTTYVNYDTLEPMLNMRRRTLLAFDMGFRR
jgi:hypothetical protein